MAHVSEPPPRSEWVGWPRWACGRTLRVYREAMGTVNARFSESEKN